MKRSFRSFLSFALSACALLATTCYALAAPVVSACRAFKVFVLDSFKLAGDKGSCFAKPVMQRVQAKAFMQRIEKRERPVVTSAWRICPSV